MPEPIPPSDFPVSFILKRGTLFGAGLGMLAGLICLAVAGNPAGGNAASIVLWRNVILIGAAAGFLIAGIVAWRLHMIQKNVENDPKEKPRERTTNRSETKT